jgi:hypothetical protein
VVAVLPSAPETTMQGGGGLIPNLGPEGVPTYGSVPAFSTVDDATAAMSLVAKYSIWRAVDSGKFPEFADTDPDRARSILTRLLTPDAPDATGALPLAGFFEALNASGQGRRLKVPRAEAAELMRCYGINVWPAIPVSSEEEAVAAASEIGYPVVMKSTANWLAHRIDLGGVRMNLENETAVRSAYLSMAALLDRRAAGKLVMQRMAPRGVSCSIGTVEDPLFGPVVSFGLAGVAGELLDDRSYRIPPLTAVDARMLIDGPKASPLLYGYRGAPVADTASLVDLATRVGRLSDDLPEIIELELNPVLVSDRGLAVLDLSLTLGVANVRPDGGVRKLLDS